MSIQQYEIFNKVAQVQSFTRAGEELNLTQSAISHAIRAFERELGLNLFFRARSGVKLTKDGEKVYRHTLNIVNAYQHLLQEVAAISGVEKGEVSIGTFASVTTHWLPGLIRKFQTHYPDIELHIYEDDYDALEAAVEKGELDCCFTVDSPNKKIEFIPLSRDRLYCIVSTESPLSREPIIKLECLEQYPLIKPKEGWDREINNLFNTYHIRPNNRYLISDDHAIISMVRADLGINIRPGLVLTDFPEGIRAIQLEVDAHRTIGLAVSSRPSLATQKFIAMACDLLKETDKEITSR